MSGATLRIALVDDQALVRAGLRALLERRGISVAIEAESGDALLEALAVGPVEAAWANAAPGDKAIQTMPDDVVRADVVPTHPMPIDVVLSDVRMPGLDGIALVHALRDRGHATPVLLLTTFDDADLLLRARDAGAQGFLLKDAAPDDLRDAIVRLARGETLLQPVSTEPVRARYRYHADDAPRALFSEREVAVLRLMAGGYSNKEIARAMFLAEGTVKNYVSAILDKLDTRDRTRAVLKAITLRVI